MVKFNLAELTLNLFLIQVESPYEVKSEQGNQIQDNRSESRSDGEIIKNGNPFETMDDD